MHEKKFSYPVVVLVQEHLPGFKRLLDLYAGKGERLETEQITEALEVIKSSGALDLTRERLVELRRRLLDDAKVLGIKQIATIVHKLDIPPQTC